MLLGRLRIRRQKRLRSMIARVLQMPLRLPRSSSVLPAVVDAAYVLPPFTSCAVRNTRSQWPMTNWPCVRCADRARKTIARYLTCACPRAVAQTLILLTQMSASRNVPCERWCENPSLRDTKVKISSSCKLRLQLTISRNTIYLLNFTKHSRHSA